MSENDPGKPHHHVCPVCNSEWTDYPASKRCGICLTCERKDKGGKKYRGK